MAFMDMKDRVPPHNLEAEQAVIGALLLDNEVIHKIIAQLKPEDFYKQSHQKIFGVINTLANRSEACDLITLTDALRANKELDTVGGAAYVSQLTSNVPSSANVEHYSRIVKECSTRRQLIRIGASMSAESYEESAESRMIIEEAEKQLFEVAENKQKDGFKKAGDVIVKTIARIEYAFNNRNKLTGVPTGFTQLDSMTSGFQESDYVIIGARPSIGKTAFALSMAAHTSIHERIPTGFFTLEMPSHLILQRLIAMEARVNSHAMRTGMLKISDFASIQDAAGVIYEAPLWISDWPNMPILDLRAQARQMVRDHQVKIIFIDYLGLISAERSDVARWEQMSDISRSLKALARELAIPIVVLSQVSRDSEGKEPSLNNIRESGAIEQDADMVMFLHRDRGTEKESSEQQEMIETKLIVAKQRNGPIGTCKIGFHSSYTRFVSLAHGE
jgi:replicative DNA helicase